MRNWKRLAAAILAAALALSLAALPASAAPGSFTDISDAGTARNADILRLMGVVSGTGGGSFNPNDTLTRAQFCTMVVSFLQKKDEVPRYSTRTIFTDVKSGHWARGYINLAASISVAGSGEENTIPLISGVGDGRFLPDNDITIGEAATILLRALGYTSKEAGAVWPQGYMDLAASVGLTDGLDLAAGSAISRAQAARLFVNALSCKTKDGKVYYETLGSSIKKKTIVLAVGVETDDGSTTGAIRTTSNANSEAYLPAHGDGNPTSLQGLRGDLVLDENEQIITFVPDESTATTIILGGDAQPGYVKAGGKQYTISSDALVFLGSDGEGRSWLDSYRSFTSGSRITLYSEKGKIVAVYSATGATTIDSDAVVVMGSVNAAAFRGLTGGVTSFNIIKDRQPIYMNQIKPYDVVTYDQVSNTLIASGLRMTATYEGAKPNYRNPTEINVLGVKFDVLKSAWDTLRDVKYGDAVSLLFTADGKVGGIVPATADTRSTAIGVVSGGSVSIYLPNGSTMSLGSVSSSLPEGQPVIVSAGKETFYVSSLGERGAPGDLNLNRMTLGSYTVSPGVRVYEKVSSGATVALDWGDLAMESIPADRIISYHVNSANLVDYIVFNDVTGDAYIYGMMVGTTVSSGEDDRGQQSWVLRRGSGDVQFSPAAGYRGRTGDMVGVVLSQDRNGNNMIKEVTELTEIRNVKGSDFFESEGGQYVTVSGRTYRIADNVECFYNRAGYKGAKENWLTGSAKDRLASIQSYSDRFTLYIDPVGQQVRIIAAN